MGSHCVQKGQVALLSAYFYWGLTIWHICHLGIRWLMLCKLHLLAISSQARAAPPAFNLFSARRQESEYRCLLFHHENCMVAAEQERDVYSQKSEQKQMPSLERTQIVEAYEIQPSPTFADFYRNICANIHVDNCSTDNVYHPHNC